MPIPDIDDFITLVRDLVRAKSTCQVYLHLNGSEAHWQIIKADFQKNPTADEVKAIRAERKARGD